MYNHITYIAGPRVLKATLQHNSSAIRVLFSGAAAPFAFGY